MELSDAMDRVEELQSMNYEMLDYLRTQLAWLLEYCKKNRIPLPDFDKAMLFFKRSGKILSDDHIQSSENHSSDEENTEPSIESILYVRQFSAPCSFVVELVTYHSDCYRRVVLMPKNLCQRYYQPKDNSENSVKRFIRSSCIYNKDYDYNEGNKLHCV